MKLLIFNSELLVVSPMFLPRYYIGPRLLISARNIKRQISFNTDDGVIRIHIPLLICSAKIGKGDQVVAAF